MPLVNGWISPEPEEPLTQLTGALAVVAHYFRVPHQILIIELCAAREAACQYLVCVGCNRLQLLARWTVSEVSCTRLESGEIQVADPASSMLVKCHAVRLFEANEFRRWADIDAFAVPVEVAQDLVKRSMPEGLR